MDGSLTTARLSIVHALTPLMRRKHRFCALLSLLPSLSNHHSHHYFFFNSPFHSLDHRMRTHTPTFPPASPAPCALQCPVVQSTHRHRWKWTTDRWAFFRRAMGARFLHLGRFGRPLGFFLRPANVILLLNPFLQHNSREMYARVVVVLKEEDEEQEGICKAVARWRA